MKITIVTAWYNEELFAPFFLTHYSYADKIHIFLDAETDDRTEEICKQYDNVEIEEIAQKNKGFSDKLLMYAENNFIRQEESDWIYALDADEFIFPPNKESARAFLARQPAYNLIYANMWQTWRHKTEADLNPLKPSIYQRRYGEKTSSLHCRRYNKPIIARVKAPPQWHPGKHRFFRTAKSEENFIGAHWKDADIERAITRNIMLRKRRFGEENIDYNSIRELMVKRAGKHLNDVRMLEVEND